MFTRKQCLRGGDTIRPLWSGLRYPFPPVLDLWACAAASLVPTLNTCMRMGEPCTLPSHTSREPVTCSEALGLLLSMLQHSAFCLRSF